MRQKYYRIARLLGMPLLEALSLSPLEEGLAMIQLRDETEAVAAGAKVCGVDYRSVLTHNIVLGNKNG